jgi:hypothetical protein
VTIPIDIVVPWHATLAVPKQSVICFLFVLHEKVQIYDPILSSNAQCVCVCVCEREREREREREHGDLDSFYPWHGKRRACVKSGVWGDGGFVGVIEQIDFNFRFHSAYLLISNENGFLKSEIERTLSYVERRRQFLLF